MGVEDKGDSRLLRGNIIFCQEPSNQYMKLLEECGWDPRVAAGVMAQRGQGWAPAIDARDARKKVTFEKKKK